MPDWDKDSPELWDNIDRVQSRLEHEAVQRLRPTLKLIKSWHVDTMQGLTADKPEYIGKFRGEPGVEGIGVRIGGVPGVHSTRVAAEVRVFEAELQRRVAALDRRYSASLDLDVAGFADVIDLAAWAHSEWARIHPFVNGNGRTARYLANFVFTRYGIGPVVSVRPRPGGDYEAAAADSMNGSHAATVNVFIQMIADQSSGKSQAVAARRARKKKD
jgi:Fic family protein